MNCQKFETVVNDLARDQIMDAAARQEALAHAALCATCDARFADENVLTTGLRRLAAEDAGRKAPVQIEARLLAAFRGQQATAHAITETSVVAKPARRLNRWWVAVAAMALIALAIAALRVQSAKVDDLPPQNAHQQEKMPDLQSPKPEPQHPQPYSQGTLPEAGQKVVEPKPRKPKRNPTVMDDLRLARNNGSSRDVRGVAGREEITTNFIPLTQGYSLAMNEGGQLVRVELPRAALSSFGLPVNSERLDEPVKADVVVGYDGIARAIRFVR